VSVATAKVAVVRGLSATSLYRETDAETGWLWAQSTANPSPRQIPC